MAEDKKSLNKLSVLSPKQLSGFVKRASKNAKKKIKKALSLKKRERDLRDMRSADERVEAVEEPQFSIFNANSSLFEGSVLTSGIAEQLYKILPATYKYQSWERIFSSQEHGYNLEAAYKRIDHANLTTSTTPGLLLVIKDTSLNVFGAFSTDTIKPRREYFGSGECFVAKLVPEFQYYRATGKNNKYVYATNEMLAFGGDVFALYVDAALGTGVSKEGSEAFDNGKLSTDETFVCAVVEIWGFRSPWQKLSST